MSKADWCWASFLFVPSPSPGTSRVRDSELHHRYSPHLTLTMPPNHSTERFVSALNLHELTASNRTDSSHNVNLELACVSRGEESHPTFKTALVLAAYMLATWSGLRSHLAVSLRTEYAARSRSFCDCCLDKLGLCEGSNSVMMLSWRVLTLFKADSGRSLRSDMRVRELVFSRALPKR